MGAEPPLYAHLPLLHGPDGKKLSKRHGAASVQELRDAGYLPEAVRNYLALLGWGDADDETILDDRRSSSSASPSTRVCRNPARFDEQKLRWLNGRYLRALPRSELTGPGAYTGRTGLGPAVAISREKIQTLADFWPLAGSIFDGPADDPKARDKWLDDEGRAVLADARGALAGAEPFRRRRWRPPCDEVVAARGAKKRDVFQAVRVAVTGTTVSPGLPETLVVLGRDESLRRIDAALAPPPSAPDRRRAARRRRPRRRRSRPGGATPCQDPGVPGTAGAGEGGLNRTSIPADETGVTHDDPPITMTPPSTATAVAPLRKDAAGATTTAAPPRSPQRGPRPPPDRRLRGARGVPRARRVARPRPAPRDRRPRLARRRRRRRRVRRRAGHRVAAPRQPGRGQDAAAGSSPSSSAVELLSPESVQQLATRARTFDFFERTTVWDAAPERFRLHAVATQRAADRLATEAGYEDRDRLMVTALLHDIGKLVLMHAYPGYPGQVHGEARTPEERIHRERRELGVDHALVGGVLARRWGLPKSVAARHRAPPRRGRHRRGRLRPPRRHARPLRAGQRRLPDRAAQGRPRRSASARRTCAGPLRPALPDRRPHRARSTRARCPRASSRCSSASPRARSTSRSRSSCSSRRARSARTCTTSTASSARSTAPRPSSSPPSAAGSRPAGAHAESRRRRSRARTARVPRT